MYARVDKLRRILSAKRQNDLTVYRMDSKLNPFASQVMIQGYHDNIHLTR
jgi:hypothetical protein